KSFIQRPITLLGERGVQLLALLGECGVQLLALLLERGVQVLTLLLASLCSVAAGPADAVKLRKQGPDQGEDADAACNERSFNSRTHNRNLVQLPSSARLLPRLVRRRCRPLALFFSVTRLPGRYRAASRSVSRLPGGQGERGLRGRLLRRG